VESHKIVALPSPQDVEALLAFAPVLRCHGAQCCTRRREVPRRRRRSVQLAPRVPLRHGGGSCGAKTRRRRLRHHQ
jgi:hypothetical protein